MSDDMTTILKGIIIMVHVNVIKILMMSWQNAMEAEDDSSEASKLTFLIL
jgi:hypothetical protein